MEDVVDITNLRLFVVVCETGSMAAAATALKLQTPAVSKRMARSETALRTKLFVRRPNGLKPTLAGEALLSHARNLVFSVERMIDEVCALGTELKGVVTICATISAISESVMDDVPGFMSQEAFKNIRVTVEEETSEHLLRPLHEGSASFGICWDHVDTEGLATYPYIRDTLCAIVPTSHPLAAGSRTSFADTLAFDYIGAPPSTSLHRQLQRAADRLDRRISYRAVVADAGAAVRMVAAGFGVCILPREVAMPQPASRKVTCILLKESWALRQLITCHRKSEDLTPAARSFLGYLLKASQTAA